ncbi:hypothetical protein NAT51_09930 [Flavobacterium amniphilum]|uniref:hypothetical protein n=1 Tax=Flavobacterium amniphilum TaxID=1834035 RepID=UPI002029EF24|nr:hypothetical protein [Flavobacterium amniphilum]MCL9805842.1 hypothetical protein [Flavobacterium amniphilum]
MRKITFLSIISLFTFITAHSQVGIGTTTPSTSSMLEIKSTNSGLLIPRINLTSSTDNTTIASPATSLLVYNTSSSADLTPGFYYWDGSWKALSGSSVPPVSGGNSWNLSGNNAVAADYMGTNNFFPIQFKVNNSDFAKFHPNGGINIGYNSVANNNNSVAIGTSAQASTNNEAIALGASANASGYQSAALGYTSTASNNSALALGHLSNSSGYRSAALGYSARATNNNGLGLGNSSNATGEQSLAIGYESNVSGQNATAIGYQATTAQANAIVLGSSLNGNSKVGVGTNAPDERLHVVGSIKMVDGNQANGYVLTSDANGKATWKNPAGDKYYGEVYKNNSTATLASGAITFGTSGLSSNTTLAGDNIQVTKTGVYKISYTVSLRKTSGGTINPEFFLTIYGTEIPGTRTYVTISNNESSTVTLTKLYSLTAYQAVSLHSSLTNAGTNIMSGSTLLVELVN